MSDRGRAGRRTAVHFQNAAAVRVPVRIGELRVANGSSILFTVGLGSCVAIALYDAPSKIGGLAHAMLPAPGRGAGSGQAGRFVVSAVPALVAQMVEQGASSRRLTARLAGGAAMFRDLLDGDGLRLGRRNVEAARAALEAAGVPVSAEDVFGTYGRSVFLRTTDGKLLITSVGHDEVLL
jgi:chemotaxis protein CheD